MRGLVFSWLGSKTAWAALAAAVLALAGGAACGENFEAGLANAPSAQRQTLPRRSHDVISNGDESCPQTVTGTDPLPNRLPRPCGESALDAGPALPDGSPL